VGVLLFTEQEWMLYWTWVDFFFFFLLLLGSILGLVRMSAEDNKKVRTQVSCSASSGCKAATKWTKKTKTTTAAERSEGAADFTLSLQRASQTGGWWGARNSQEAACR